MFDSQCAMAHCRRIAQPRLVGTDGEREVRAYCINTLKKQGMHTSEQSFNFTKRASFLLQVVPFIYGVVLLSLALLFKRPSWIVLCVFVFILLSIACIRNLVRHIGKLHFRGKTRLNSTNIITHLPAHKREKEHLVFMAHYDSKSQTLPIAFRALCFIGLGMSTVTMALNHLVSLYSTLLPFCMLNRICGYLGGACGLFLFFNGTQNKSPGAADNAAGAAIVLELARLFFKNPLQNVSCSFVLTGAEEFGLVGASYFIANHTIIGKPRFINIDGVGGKNSIGIVLPKSGKTIAGDLKRIASGLVLPAKIIRTLPGAGFDHAPISAAGYEAITLCSRSVGMVLRLHSGRDTIDTVMQEALQGIGTLCEEYARELDAGR